MLIFALDDKPLLLQGLKRCILEAEPSAEVLGFKRAAEVLELMEKEKLKPDVAFLDIEMPGMSGLELAKRMKENSPDTNIVFVTGYSQYAVEAMSMRTSGYLVKPVSAEDIRRELDNLRYPIRTEWKKRIRIQCFGNFDVCLDGRPIHFKRSKVKELFAYLVDRKGASCTAGEVMGILWEDAPNSISMQSNLRNLIHDLKNLLKDAGVEEVLIRGRGTIAINRAAVDCDYYDFLDNKPYAVNLYRGEYMSQYSWSEMTTASLGRNAIN